MYRPRFRCNGLSGKCRQDLWQWRREGFHSRLLLCPLEWLIYKSISNHGVDCLDFTLYDISFRQILIHIAHYVGNGTSFRQAVYNFSFENRLVDALQLVL